MMPHTIMKYRKFGSTNVEVSEIGFGGWAIGADAHGNSYGPTTDADSLRAVETAIALGCTFFDTVDAYGHGHSEELYGKAFKGRRDKVVLATAGGSDFSSDPVRSNFGSEYLVSAVEASLRRLQTDYIDLYQLHNPPFSVLENGRIFEGLERLKSQGKIRHYGVSVHDPQVGLIAIKAGRPSAIQIAYNWLRREAAEELFPRALEQGVAIIIREPLANGFLTGKYTKDSIFPVGDIRHQWPSKYQSQLIHQIEDFSRTAVHSPFTLAQTALRFILSQPAVSVVIPGCKTVEQVEENFRTSNLAFPVVAH